MSFEVCRRDPPPSGVLAMLPDRKEESLGGDCGSWHGTKPQMPRITNQPNSTKYVSVIFEGDR